MVLMNEKLCKYEVHFALFEQTEKCDSFGHSEAEDTEDDQPLLTNASGFL